MNHKMSLKEFMEEVEKRLKSFSLDTIRRIIINWAKDIPSAKRYEFLAMLVPPAVEPQKQSPAEDLLKEIQNLRQRVQHGDYVEGWGWDDEIHEERDWGDESWDGEVDEFLNRAHKALLEGHYELAQKAYAGIFKILEMGEEPGHLPGSFSPEDMLNTDWEEAQACYLRAIYLSSTLDKRPTELLKAMQRFTYSIGDNLNLTSIIHAGCEQLPDLAEFLNRWVDLLKNPHNDATRYLLREALMFSWGHLSYCRVSTS